VPDVVTNLQPEGGRTGVDRAAGAQDGVDHAVPPAEPTVARRALGSGAAETAARGPPSPDLFDEVTGDLVEEPAGRVVLAGAEQHPTPGVGEVEPLLGPGDADIGEAALLFHLVGLAEGPDVREDPVLQADAEHDRELESLGRVEGHEHDRRVVLGELVGVGHQADLFEELVDRSRTAGHPDQFLEVLDPAFGLDRTLILELGHVAGVAQHRLEQRGRVALDEIDEAVELGEEPGDARTARPPTPASSARRSASMKV
jgi:hypothetical protein